MSTDPIVEEIDRLMADGTWARAVGAIAAAKADLVGTSVFVLVTPATAQGVFAKETPVGQRSSALVALVPLEEARAAFLSLKLLPIASILARGIPAGQFRMVAQACLGWRVIGGPLSALPQQPRGAHAVKLARIGADGGCAGDVCSARGGDA